MSRNQEYAQQYAEYAMEQMRRYGIPASVTLAQGILESSNGRSRLAQNENNHFGIKATLHGLPKAADTVCIRTTNPTKNFAAMTAWAIHTNTTPVF